MNPLPSDAPDYLIALAILASVAGTWITTRTQKRQGAELSEVREHVSNTHNTNLRDDIDAIHHEVRASRLESRQDIAELRGEVRQVRGETRELRAAVRQVTGEGI